MHVFIVIVRGIIVNFTHCESFRKGGFSSFFLSNGIDELRIT